MPPRLRKTQGQRPREPAGHAIPDIDSANLLQTFHSGHFARFTGGALLASLIIAGTFRKLPASAHLELMDLLSEDLRRLPFDYPLFEFGVARSIIVSSGDSLQVANGSLTWHVGNFSKRVELFQVEGLIHADNVTKMLHELPDSFSMEPDSVDKLPSFEYYLQHHAGHGSSPFPAPKNLLTISNAVIEERVLPLVRHLYNCSGCRVCTSLVRRYQSDQRTRHPPHFDTQSFITIVVSLATHGVHYRGGLYVRTAPGSEQFVHAKTGDAVLHQYDVEHGVWVREGSRYSWILWVQDSPQCEGPRVSWHKGAASQGDPIAQYHMSTMYSSGRGGVSKNEHTAATLLHKAASQGYSRAQQKLGNAFFQGIGVEEDESKALEWYVAAAKQNFSLAAYSAGRMLEYGFGADKDDAAAARWYQKAAADSFEHSPDAADRLAGMLFKGVPGVQSDGQMALSLWRQAASQGQASAAISLAERYERGEGVEANAEEARRWRARAAEIDHRISAA